MVDNVPECGLGEMLKTLSEMNSGKKWGVIVDTNGNVATFGKYKANYMSALEYASKEAAPPKDKLM